MNDSVAGESGAESLSHEEMMSAMFGHMVIQNTNMALMFLGQVPHPETKERIHDFQAARMFIDQLEMLEVKTKGNLSREEEKLLQQSLMHLRMTFVQAVENAPKEAASPAGPAPKSEAAPAAPPAAGESSASEEEPRKRFSKKF